MFWIPFFHKCHTPFEQVFRFDLQKLPILVQIKLCRQKQINRHLTCCFRIAQLLFVLRFHPFCNILGWLCIVNGRVMALHAWIGAIGKRAQVALQYALRMPILKIHFLNLLLSMYLKWYNVTGYDNVQWEQCSTGDCWVWECGYMTYKNHRPKNEDILLTL